MTCGFAANRVVLGAPKTVFWCVESAHRVCRLDTPEQRCVERTHQYDLRFCWEPINGVSGAHTIVTCGFVRRGPPEPNGVSRAHTIVTCGFSRSEEPAGGVSPRGYERISHGPESNCEQADAKRESCPPGPESGQPTQWRLSTGSESLIAEAGALLWVLRISRSAEFGLHECATCSVMILTPQGS